jgi:hypothetical protein
LAYVAANREDAFTPSRLELIFTLVARRSAAPDSADHTAPRATVRGAIPHIQVVTPQARYRPGCRIGRREIVGLRMGGGFGGRTGCTGFRTGCGFGGCGLLSPRGLTTRTRFAMRTSSRWVSSCDTAYIRRCVVQHAARWRLCGESHSREHCTPTAVIVATSGGNCYLTCTTPRLRARHY